MCPHTIAEILSDCRRSSKQIEHDPCRLAGGTFEDAHAPSDADVISVDSTKQIYCEKSNDGEGTERIGYEKQQKKKYKKERFKFQVSLKFSVPLYFKPP